jgi:type III secretion system low calcium response chaperone LcrH/SycD
MTQLAAPPDPTISLVPNWFGTLDGVQALKARLAELPAATRFTDEQIEVIYGIAHSLYQQGKFETSCSLFQVLMVYRPLDARVMLAFAIACKRLLRFDAAIPAFAAAVALNPSDLSGAVHLSECLAAVGKRQECTQVLDPLIHLASLDEQYANIKKRAETLRELLNKETPHE